MRIQLEVVTPLGTIVGDECEGTDKEYDLMTHTFKNVDALSHINIKVGGNDVFVPNHLLKQSYIKLVKIDAA